MRTEGVRVRRHALGRAALAVLAGLATWLAFPPTGWWPLAIVGAAGFMLAVRGQTLRRGAGLGLLYGLALFLPLLSWMAVTGVDALLLLALLEAGGTALTGAALAAVSRLRGWPLWSALVWIAGELVRANVPFGGFPWGRLAFATAGTPYAPYAALGGVALVSAAVALSGGLLAYAWLQLRRGSPTQSASAAARLSAGAAPDLSTRAMTNPTWPLWCDVRRCAAALGVVAAVPAAALLIPIGASAGATANAPPVTVALVQGNVPAVGLEFLGRARTVTRNHRDATIELGEAVAAGDATAPDVVIWPENSTDIDPFTDAETRAVIEEAVAAVDVPILVGAILDGPGEGYRRTAGVLWNPGSGPDEDQIYVKRHPVPFGEYIPLRQQLLPLVGRLEQVGRDTFAGDAPGVMDLGPVTVGDVICFEIAYDSIVRDVVTGGAGVLVVQTNNATFGLSAQPEQQFAISRLRAIEHGRTVLVAATSGISGVIDADGGVRERTGKFTREVVVADVTPQTGLTIATRLGPWPEWLLAAGGLGCLLVALASKRRSTSTAAVPSPRVDADRPVGTAA